MKTSKIITATIVAAVITASSFAHSDKAANGRPSSKDITAIMLDGHDANFDGALDTAELANAIEGLYDMRKDAIVNRRDAMVENGYVSESSNGVITFSLLPEDSAAIVMKHADVNQDNLLHADEILVSLVSLRSLDLGTRSAITRSS